MTARPTKFFLFVCPARRQAQALSRDYWRILVYLNVSVNIDRPPLSILSLKMFFLKKNLKKNFKKEPTSHSFWDNLNCAIRTLLVHAYASSSQISTGRKHHVPEYVRKHLPDLISCDMDQSFSDPSVDEDTMWLESIHLEDATVCECPFSRRIGADALRKSNIWSMAQFTRIQGEDWARRPAAFLIKN